MSNNDNNYQQRLESLFSGIEPLPPEPTPEPPPQETPPAARLQGIAIAPEALQSQVAELEAAIARAQQQAEQERQQREAESAKLEAAVAQAQQQAEQERQQREAELAKLEAAVAQAQHQADEERRQREAALSALESLRDSQATAQQANIPPAEKPAEPPPPAQAARPQPGAKPPPVKDSAPVEKDKLAPAFTVLQWREHLLTTLLRGASALGAPALAIALLGIARDGNWLLGGFYISVYLILLVAAFYRLRYRWRAGVFLLIVYGLAASSLLEYGLSGNGRLYLYAFTTITALLLGPRSSLAALVISLSTIGGTGWLMTTGMLATPANEATVSADGLTWATGVIIFLLLAAVVLRGLTLLKSEFVSTRYREQGVLEELQREREQLEQRVAERTKLIERRTTQIVTGAEVARAASAELNPDELLRQAVNLIRERFELYYVGAFLVDETERYAVLRVGTGEAGQAMLANRHRLEVGGNSMIGRAVSEGQARLALDVGFEGIRFNNPALPNTRSEMALPLIARDHVLGAVTIQSDQPEAFSPEDIVSLQGMTDLIAIALDNAHLFQEAQNALAEVTALHQRYLSQAWANFAKIQSDKEGRMPTFAYANNTLIQGGAVDLPGIEKVVESQAPVVTAGEFSSTVTVPLKLRDQVIGAISVEAEDSDHVWEPGELALIEAAAEQAALALENARLIEEAETALAEARRLAAREQTVNIISDKIRRLPDVDSILSTALVELGKTLGAGKGMVRLGGPRNGHE
jgi:GAF domain-containing protein